MEMLNEMPVFSQVVDSGSFSAAARHLVLTTSAVSRHVGRLEKHLGGRLLLRTTRALSLTELGQQVYASCERMLGNAREVHALAGSYGVSPTGTLRLGAPVVFGQNWLAPKLPGFLEKFPDVNVTLTLIDRPVDLVHDGVDLAIRIGDTVAPGLITRPLCTFEYVLIASPEYLRRHGTPAAPEELTNHCCSYLGYGRFGHDWTLTDGTRSVSVSVTGRLTINNSAALVAAVAEGGAIGLVPEFAAQSALGDGRVVRILAAWQLSEPYVGSAQFVYTPGRYIARKIRAFIDYFVSDGPASPV